VASGYSGNRLGNGRLSVPFRLDSSDTSSTDDEAVIIFDGVESGHSAVKLNPTVFVLFLPWLSVGSSRTTRPPVGKAEFIHSTIHMGR